MLAPPGPSPKPIVKFCYQFSFFDFHFFSAFECKLAFFVDSLFASVLFSVRVCLRCAQPEILPIPPLRSNQGCSLHSWLQRRTLRVYSRLCSWLRFQLALSTMIRGEHCTSEGGIKYRVFPLYAVTDIVFFHCTRQRI